jgi:preprotein translocase subunit SecG
MITLVTILILLACIVLAFFVLVQNPKGGGLAGSFGSLGNQVMGVKQSTDVMEKGTWTTMGIIAALCIVAVSFYPKIKRATDDAPARQGSSAPASKPGANTPQSPAGNGPAPAAPKP